MGGAAFLGIMVAGAFAQSTAVISYEASVKPNNAVDARTISEYSPGGYLNATAITVRALLRTAYRVQDFQITGAPGWLTTKRFDIAARAEGSPPPTQPALIQAVLKDRFGLAVHNETRESQVFSLVPVKSDGKLGPKVVRSDFDCDTYRATPRSPADLARNGLKCAYRSNSGDFTGYAIQMSELAQVLSFFVGRPVTDKTGLAGRFDMALQWMPDAAAAPDDAVGPVGLDVTMEQLRVSLAAQPVKLEDLIPLDKRLLVLAIGKPDGKMIFNPPVDSYVADGDILIVMGEQPSLRNMERVLAGSAKA